MPPSPDPKETFSPFVKLLVALGQSQVEFAVVGGVAVFLNGYPRTTLDLDILVKASPDNLEKMLACLRNWGEGWARELSPADFSYAAGCVRISENFDLDIFTQMLERNYEDFSPRFRFLEMAEVRISYLAPEDLIYLKEGSWRDKDKLDVQALREIIRQRE